jgi:hypothetical protein
MTDHVPISFDHNGTHFEGFFNEMTNGSHWHLMINNYYYGQLIYSEVHGFRFSSNKGSFEDLSEFFGEHIRNWRKQNL